MYDTRPCSEGRVLARGWPGPAGAGAGAGAGTGACLLKILWPGLFHCVFVPTQHAALLRACVYISVRVREGLAALDLPEGRMVAYCLGIRPVKYHEGKGKPELPPAAWHSAWHVTWAQAADFVAFPA